MRFAHFYASVTGNKGTVSRLGTKQSGITAVAASWEGCVKSFVYRNESRDEDWVSVTLGEWRGKGARPAILLYEGPISGVPEQIARRMSDDK